MSYMRVKNFNVLIWLFPKDSGHFGPDTNEVVCYRGLNIIGSCFNMVFVGIPHHLVSSTRPHKRTGTVCHHLAVPTYRSKNGSRLSKNPKRPLLITTILQYSQYSQPNRIARREASDLTDLRAETSIHLLLESRKHHGKGMYQLSFIKFSDKQSKI